MCKEVGNQTKVCMLCHLKTILHSCLSVHVQGGCVYVADNVASRNMTFCFRHVKHPYNIVECNSNIIYLYFVSTTFNSRYISVGLAI